MIPPDDWFDMNADPRHVARERAKARELRSSEWWRRQLAKGICHYCGRPFPPEELTMDHVVPVARGGRSVKGNVVPCCKDCNNRKKYMTPVDMILKKLEAEEAARRNSGQTDSTGDPASESCEPR